MTFGSDQPVNPDIFKVGVTSGSAQIVSPTTHAIFVARFTFVTNVPESHTGRQRPEFKRSHSSSGCAHTLVGQLTLDPVEVRRLA